MKIEMPTHAGTGYCMGSSCDVQYHFTNRVWLQQDDDYWVRHGPAHLPHLQLHRWDRGTGMPAHLRGAAPWWEHHIFKVREVTQQDKQEYLQDLLAKVLPEREDLRDERVQLNRKIVALDHKIVTLNCRAATITETLGEADTHAATLTNKEA